MNPPLVCCFPLPPDNVPRNATETDYVDELIAYWGLEVDRVAPTGLADALPAHKILLTVGEGALPGDFADWLSAGGVWIAVSGTCGREDLLGVRRLAPDYLLWGGAARSLGEGWTVAAGDHPIGRALETPLHHFGGVAVVADGARILASTRDAHGALVDTVGVSEHAVGAGTAILLAPDIVGAIVRIQMGNPVHRDGVPAADGTAPVGDGIRKSDDGIVLDWIFDRRSVPETPDLRCFLDPQADLWRELMLRTLFHASTLARVPLRLLFYWPDNLPAIGHLSHDSDGNDPERAEELLDALARADAPGTWCIILPGYSPELTERIRAAGHELATHYDAMSAGTIFSEREFDQQWSALRTQFGQDPVSNKNHYLRWEGDVDILRWCIDRGIRIDQSKGASKTGAAGFAFGSCHPYRPVDAEGRLLDILELATPTQDLHVFAPETLARPLLESALRAHGVAHFLFHPAHMNKPNVADSLVRTVQAGRDLGMRWWTAERMVGWDRARRTAKWNRGTLHAGEPLPGATVLVHAPWANAPMCSGETMGATQRWGVDLHVRVLDLESAATVAVEAVP